MQALALSVNCGNYDVGKKFERAAAGAGAALSSKMRDMVQDLEPDSAFVRHAVYVSIERRRPAPLDTSA